MPERIICGALGLLLLALVPSTLRGSMAFIPHFLAAPGRALIGIRMGVGDPPGYEAPETPEERRSSAVAQVALAVLLLISAASSWVLYTFDRWLVVGVAAMMITLVGVLTALQGALVLYAGIHERWAWHFVVPAVDEPEDGPAALPLDQHEDAVRGGFQDLGTALLARVMPWWAAGLLHLVLGGAVLAVVASAVLAGELPGIANVVLEFAGAAVYVLGAAAFMFMLVVPVRTPEARFKSIVALGLLFIVGNALGAPEMHDAVDRLGERLGQ